MASKIKQKKNASTGKETFILESLENFFSPCKIKVQSKSNRIADFLVEIINPLSNPDKRLASGRKFLLQIIHQAKLQKEILIEPGKLESWQKSTAPLMLVILNPNDQFSYLWLDDGFYSAVRAKYGSGWMASNQIAISVDLFKKLRKEEVLGIENYLMVLTQSKSLPKGAFFNFRGELKSQIGNFIAYSDKNQIPIENLGFNRLLEKTENAIYTISIVGPSRTGKSTLINALMKKEISPVDILPTTGVPFSIQPGKSNEAVVIFFDGTEKRGPANVRFLEKYIDQKYNPKNTERVKLVTVYLDDDRLENGLAYCDVPGLDDVDDEIRRVSKIAVYSSNAIIYLVDISPYKYGGFSINAHHLNDLRELAPKMDKLYLVFNKIDALNEKELLALKEYIDRVLLENDILKFLPTPPLYISAKLSFESIKKKNKDYYGVGGLEALLWENLLKSNRNGLYNLGGLIYEFLEELRKLSSILNARLLDTNNSADLINNLNNIKKQLANISLVRESGKDDLLKWLRDYINESTKEILDNLECDLAEVPDDLALPNSYAIRQYLENSAFTVLTQIFDEVNFRLDSLYDDLNNWVKNELAQTEFFNEKVYEPLRDKSNIEKIVKPIRDSFSQGLPAAINMLSRAASFIGDAIVGIFSFIEVLFVGRAKIRERQVKQIMTKARHSYFSVFNKAQLEFSGFIKSQYNVMIKQLRDRTEVYIGEINKQLNKLNQPANPLVKAKFEEGIKEIDSVVLIIERIKNELTQYLN